MPAYSVDAVYHEVLGAFVSCSSVHEVDFWEAFGATTCEVDVWTAKVLRPAYCFLDGEVRKILVVENDKFPLGNKKRQLVFCSTA